MTAPRQRLAGPVLAVTLVAAACTNGTGTTSIPPPTGGPPTTSAAPTTAATSTSVAPSTTITPTTVAPAEPLVVWADPIRAPVLEAVAADFERAGGVPVAVEVVPFADIRSNLALRGPAGSGPDVFVGAHEWIGDLAGRGVIEPLPLGAAAAALMPVARQAFSFEGETYGLPHAVEAIGLYRNTDLVPDAPASFEELLAACDAVAGRVARCLALPAGDDAYHHYPFLASGGGYVFAYDPETGYDVGDLGIAGEGAVAGFSLFDALVRDGVLDPGVDYGTMTDLFLSGRTAFMWTGPWELANVQAAGVGYAVSVLPTIEGRAAVPFVTAQGLFVSAFGERQDLARAFVVDFAAAREVSLGLAGAGPGIPAHAGASAVAAADPDLEAFRASAADGHPIPNVPEMEAAWGPLDRAVLDVYGQSVDPATALAAAQLAVEAALAEG